MSGSDKRRSSDPDEHTILTRVTDFPTYVGDNKPYLRVIHPRDAVASYALTEDGLVLGRGADVDVPLSTASISREHCQVSRGASGIIVEDLGSTNGTFIDGQRVQSAYLSPASRLKVGPFVLKVEYKGEVELSAENSLMEAARTDALTGIPNRGWFVKQAAALLSELDSPDGWLTTVMVDIDHFKSINDRFGHAAGDEVIRSVARYLQEQMRDRDLVGRYGGEEFVMLLPHTDRSDALIFCDRIREGIAQTQIGHGDSTLNVCVSIGFCSSMRAEITSLDGLIRAADAALYRAKRQGRNRVCD